MEEKVQQDIEENEEKSFFSIIVHSFFIIPFLIAVFCVLLFVGMHLLTREKRSVYDYLEDVKIGGMNKRWQGAFELSKILSNPRLLPDDPRFANELISAFRHAKHDDNRVRQYLALAMGRTHNTVFLEALIEGLQEAKEENIPAIIYALGMLGDKQALKPLYSYIDHPDSRIRSITVVSLGHIGDPASKAVLRKGLGDSEPNVQWGAAISLAKMGDASGKAILLKLLDREYLSRFPEVDRQEQKHLMIEAIRSTVGLTDQQLLSKVRDISQNDKNMKVRAVALERLK